ncbi:cytochrome c oxidase subunit II [Chloroflexi bacterium TSY]|nr:cytochrome c oxidase subunit II [Chloroflexi bacterium TSY]
MGLLENISTYGGDIDSLYYIVLIITAIAFFLVEGVLVMFLVRYRHQEGRVATYSHGNRQVEILWTVVPGIMLFGLAIYQYDAWTNIKIDLPPVEESVVLRLEAEQFEWYAFYPGPDGELNTDDDLEAPVNTVHVPVNKPVIVYLTARDILHSFFVPVLRVKQDAVPGTTIPVWFEATKTGEYEIVCAEVCGLGHYRMRGFLTIESEDEFAAWQAEIAAR